MHDMRKTLGLVSAALALTACAADPADRRLERAEERVPFIDARFGGASRVMVDRCVQAVAKKLGVDASAVHATGGSLQGPGTARIDVTGPGKPQRCRVTETGVVLEIADQP